MNAAGSDCANYNSQLLLGIYNSIGETGGKTSLALQNLIFVS